MKWRNETNSRMMPFKDLPVGEVFEFDEIFFIKTSCKDAFDIINNQQSRFDDFDSILQHDHEIVVL